MALHNPTLVIGGGQSPDETFDRWSPRSDYWVIGCKPRDWYSHQVNTHVNESFGMQQAQSTSHLHSLDDPELRRPDTFATRVVIALDRVIYRFTGRWLFGFNLVVGVYALTVILAPILAALGQSTAAKPLYGFFGLFCHQDPERSFHLFGQKFACCERCAAIYGSIALCGLLFAFVRGRLRTPRYAELVALVSPVVLDGMAVGSGMYSGNMMLRVITGSLVGLALIWFLYPRFETGFASMRARLKTLFDRLAAQGRAKPLAG